MFFNLEHRVVQRGEDLACGERSHWPKLNSMRLLNIVDNPNVTTSSPSIVLAAHQNKASLQQQGRARSELSWRARELRFEIEKSEQHFEIAKRKISQPPGPNHEITGRYPSMTHYPRE